jgi:hypothetical protein
LFWYYFSQSLKQILAKDHFYELLQQQFGKAIEQKILINLAQAARIYTKLWLGMEGAEPASA